jgi:hypothetical protein
MRLIAGIAGVSLFAASGCGGTTSSPRHSAVQLAADAIVKHTIDAAVSVPPGSSRVIYAVPERSAVIGRFLGTCPEGAAPRTEYRPTRRAADAIAAVDGRGVSRAATVVFGQRLNGGHRTSGLEQWLVRTGRESENVTVDASLEIVRERGSPDCTFWLYGSLTVLSR